MSLSKKIVFLFFLLLPILFFVGKAQAAVINSVSGTYSHNSSVTISGSAFGTKSRAMPELWDNFESGGNVGQSVANSSRVSWQTDGTAPVFSTTNNRNSGTGSRNAAAVVSGMNIDGNYHDLMYRDGLDLGGYAYIAFWGRFASYAAGDQVKYWRIGTNGASGYPTYSYFRTDGWARYQFTNPASGTCAPPGGSAWYDSVENTNLGQWQFIEMIANFGTVDTANGYIHVFANGVDQGGKSDFILKTSSSCSPDTVRFGEYIQDSSGTVTNYFDDIYVDNTWARVVLGNASTYTASTHREIQIPTAWSSGSITITTNLGTFTSGQTAYLYVIDANGNVSNGYPVTIGSGGTTPTCSNCCSTTQTCPTAFTTVGSCTRCCATACLTASTDTTAPRVTSFTVTPTTLNVGASITANYTVTDNTALSRAELWRAPQGTNCTDTTKTGCVWTQVTSANITGTSRTGTFTSSPTAAGTFYYGLHAVDSSNNVGYEPAPVRVVINAPAQTCSNCCSTTQTCPTAM
ncbi:MAG: hypothetical protein V1867_01970, partial [Candidatus Falkowbacteria bacterium]